MTSIVKVCLCLQLFGLDSEYVVQYGSFKNVVYSSQIELGALVHGQNLPVASAIFGYSTKIRSTEIPYILRPWVGGGDFRVLLQKNVVLVSLVRKSEFQLTLLFTMLMRLRD